MSVLPPALAETPNSDPAEAGRIQQTLGQRSLDPTSDLKQIQVQNRFIPNTFDADGYSNIQTTRFLYPIPKSEINPIRQLWRATFPIVTVPGGPTGLGDIRLFDLLMSEKKDTRKGRWWRYWLGPLVVFPSANDDRFGAGKWQIGPIAATVLQAKDWQAAIIIQNPISFAGDSDRRKVNRLSWQPILVFWLDQGWYWALQGTPKTVNWENDAAATIPLSARVGKVIKFGRRSINVFVEPEYTAIHDDGPVAEWSILLGLNFLFPL